MSGHVASEALFGSQSRGDADAFSDRDILIVDDDHVALSKRREILESDGWSVASYTFRKLETLAQKRALFLQHLKFEAKITRDVGGRLRDILDDFAPKQDYSAELIENAQLASIARLRPDTTLGSLWACDVLYVAVRNFGILALASKGCHVYGYSDVLGHLVEFGMLREAAVPSLLKLRFAKSLYRSSIEVPNRRARILLDAAVAHLPDHVTVGPFRALSPRDLISNVENLPAGSPNYHRLRSLERTYVALLSLAPVVAQQPEFTTLRRWIRNPRAYAGYASQHEPRLNELFANLSSWRASDGAAA